MVQNIFGSEFEDDLTGSVGNDTIYGYGGNDVLRGGLGNDVLIGGEGADTYVYAGDWGQDVITDGGSENHIFFRDVTLADLKFEQVGMDLLIRKIGTDEHITISNQFRWLDENWQDFLLTDNVISHWEFADGLVLNAQQIHRLLENSHYQNLYQTRINNVNNQEEIHGSTASEAIYGNARNDVIFGGGGSDTLIGGSGADTYVVSTLFSAPATESETIKIIDGQANNHIYFNRSLLSDVVFMRGNLNAEDLHVLSTKGFEGRQAVTIYGQYDNYNDWDGKSVVNWEFADGQILKSSHIEVLTKMLFKTGQGNDDNIWDDGRLVGSNGNDEIYGTEHHEILFGQYGNDVLNGGAGDDVLVGGVGADTYVFNGNWGQDHIMDFNADNHMYFRDVNAKDVAFVRDGEDLLIHKLNSSEQIRIMGQFKNGTDTAAQVIVNWEFADGQIFKASDVNAVTQMTNAMAAMGNTDGTAIASNINTQTDIQLAAA
ncbi:calcium-binding protein [Vitreoscilla massiliensis]|uniref:Calcium-binding protein n=1 Tax=Vitreoscilla massiliensis TaxID=1689272 RepID=A0ABY4DY20_9NEIS|nr:calcium-binding protein [Vitreoscilla massiliensis]UOO88202.1 calcium-binding protein [Vitreoscilla massiliensis]